MYALARLRSTRGDLVEVRPWSSSAAEISPSTSRRLATLGGEPQRVECRSPFSYHPRDAETSRPLTAGALLERLVRAAGSAVGLSARVHVDDVEDVRRGRHVGQCPARSSCRCGRVSWPSSLGHARRSRHRRGADGRAWPRNGRRLHRSWGVPPGNETAKAGRLSYSCPRGGTRKGPGGLVSRRAPRCAGVRQATGFTVEACRPLSPSVISNSTLCPWTRVLYPSHGDLGVVHEQVVPVFPLDEAIPLLVAEPLHGALRHD